MPGIPAYELSSAPEEMTYPEIFLASTLARQICTGSKRIAKAWFRAGMEPFHAQGEWDSWTESLRGNVPIEVRNVKNEWVDLSMNDRVMAVRHLPTGEIRFRLLFGASSGQTALNNVDMFEIMAKAISIPFYYFGNGDIGIRNMGAYTLPFDIWLSFTGRNENDFIFNGVQMENWDSPQAYLERRETRAQIERDAQMRRARRQIERFISTEDLQTRDLLPLNR